MYFFAISFGSLITSKSLMKAVVKMTYILIIQKQSIIISTSLVNLSIFYGPIQILKKLEKFIMTYVYGTNANSIMSTKNHRTSHILYLTDVFGSLIRKFIKEKLFLFLI